jgi:hypothetical protein
MIFRVWHTHERMNHISLDTLTHMVQNNQLRNAKCTAREMQLVADHQDCWSCALSKWKKLNSTPNSGISPNIVGEHWSADTIPYSTTAIGGYRYEFFFVDLSCGYLCVFFGKLKSVLHTIIEQPLSSLRISLEDTSYRHGSS